MVGGRTVNRLIDNPFSSISQLIVDIVYKHYNANPDKARFFASNNLAIPAGLFRQIGAFDPRFRTSEDRELCDRLLFHGAHLVYEPKAVVYHSHDLTFGRFVSQHFSYGRGAHRFHKLRANRGSGRFLDEVHFHLNSRNWLFSPLTRMNGRRRGLALGLILTWQLVNAVGFCWQALTAMLENHGRSHHGNAG